jgi:hypothetical protein
MTAQACQHFRKINSDAYSSRVVRLEVESTADGLLGYSRNKEKRERSGQIVMATTKP